MTYELKELLIPWGLFILNNIIATKLKLKNTMFLWDIQYN